MPRLDEGAVDCEVPASPLPQPLSRGERGVRKPFKVPLPAWGRDLGRGPDLVRQDCFRSTESLQIEDVAHCPRFWIVGDIGIAAVQSGLNEGLYPLCAQSGMQCHLCFGELAPVGVGGL